jgi:hypothetical protein
MITGRRRSERERERDLLNSSVEAVKDRLRLGRLDVGSLVDWVVGGGWWVISWMGMATVGTPPYINKVVSTWNAFDVQEKEARDSLIA